MEDVEGRTRAMGGCRGEDKGQWEDVEGRTRGNGRM